MSRILDPLPTDVAAEDDAVSVARTRVGTQPADPRRLRHLPPARPAVRGLHLDGALAAGRAQRHPPHNVRLHPGPSLLRPNRVVHRRTGAPQLALEYDARAGTFDFLPVLLSGDTRQDLSRRISYQYPLWVEFDLRPAAAART
jgi:hypothetical protein